MIRLALLGGVTLLLTTGIHELGARPTKNEHVKEHQFDPKLSHELLQKLKSDISQSRPLASEVQKALREGADKDNLIKRMCVADFLQFQDLENGPLKSWRESWRRKDISSFLKWFSDDIESVSWSPKMVLRRERDGIKEFDWDKGPVLKGTKQIRKEMENYLGQFKAIEDFEITALSFLSPNHYRHPELTMKMADLHVRYDLRGTDKNNQRRHDRGQLKVHIKQNGKSPVISRIEGWGQETLTSVAPSFQEVTIQSGVLEAVPEYQRVEAIRRGGYALAIGDYDNDGIQDMFVGSLGSGKLLKGLGNGRFEEAQVTGLDNETYVKTAIFSDFDNDGLQDLLLVRFVPNIEEGTKSSDIVIYKNTGNGGFKKQKEIGNRSPSDHAMPATVADFDQDGRLDFYVGFPGAKDFTVLGEVKRSDNVQAQGLFFNKGNMNFTPMLIKEWQQPGQESPLPSQKMFPHSALAVDFDQDQDMDILVIDDRGQLSPAYQNRGDGTFYQVARQIGMANEGHGMGAAVGDWDNDGVLDFLMTNVNFNAVTQFYSSCLANWDWGLVTVKVPGLRAFKGIKKGKFVDVIDKDNGLTYPGEGLAGVEFIDYNNDGHLDIYLANGLWSGTDRHQDLSSYFLLNRDFGSNLSLNTSSDAPDSTQSGIMKILAGFQGDIHTGKTEGSSRPHLAGFQRNRLYRNNGDGTFTEVGHLEGVDSIADGYIVAKADLDNNGTLDLILRNGDPGTKDVNFPSVQVFLNNHRGNKSLRVRLEAVNSNRDAIGSEVMVKTKEKTVWLPLLANNGAAQSEKIVHLGLGAEEKAQEVRIRWPNGKQTILNDVPAGVITVNEAKGHSLLGKNE